MVGFGDLTRLFWAGDLVGLQIWLRWAGLESWSVLEICWGWKFGLVGLDIWLSWRFNWVQDVS